MPGRATRRHHAERCKCRVTRFLRDFYPPDDLTPTVVGRRAVTPAPCSCWMCGNPRRWGHVTRQELHSRAAENAGRAGQADGC